ncbi:MAG: adenylosuccinate synthase [Alphaproteobacteria bacterium]|nr:adenylosuccinate synthase [Alphaproteobacteria bacterium]
MNRASAILCSALLLLPSVVLAHGDPPQAAHGGQMQEAHENWIELVVSGTQVKLYVLNEERKPVPATQVSGSASLLVGSKIYKIQLAPRTGNSLDGELPVPASGASAATVFLRIGGQPATARFTLGS